MNDMQTHVACNHSLAHLAYYLCPECGCHLYTFHNAIVKCKCNARMLEVELDSSGNPINIDMQGGKSRA